MIVEEIKSDSTLIRFDDTYIETNRDDKEVIDILIGLIVRKFSE